MMDKRPNILVIFPDQWRGDCLQHLGHPVVETPYLTELAGQGVTFTRAYTTCPSCIAARASLVTGMFPNSTGRLGYRDKVPWTYPNTLMRTLRDGGYQTINVGKTHFYPQRAHLGYEINELYDTQRIDFGFEADYDRWLAEKTQGQIVDTTVDMNSNSWLAQPWVHPEHLHPTSWTSTRAIELLQRRDPQRPFFLTLNYHRPHPPIDPPLTWFQRFEHRELPPVPVGDWAGDFDRPVTDLQAHAGRLPQHTLDRTRRAYYAQIAHLDFQIGRVIWYLQKYLHALDNTLIVFASDHGEMLGDHHLWRKFNAFEGSASIPLIIRPPRSMNGALRNTRDDRITCLEDLMPTLLDLAGVEIPSAVEGRSLAPALRGEQGDWRTHVHGEHERAGGGWQFVTDGHEKFVWQTRTDQEWFFDLRTDPQELHNAVNDPQFRERANLWRQRLVDELAKRPEDDLVENGRLKPGKTPPAVRKWLLEQAGVG
jgi:arylsulfatase